VTRVGIDATYLLAARKSGVETYTLNLVRALLALRDRPELFLYAASRERPPDAEPLFAAADGARVSPIPRLWLRARMPLAMAWDRVTVAHFPGTLLPAWLPCPVVTTFYDLAALHYPEMYDPAELRHYEALIPSAARRSAAIIAISESTKRDLVARMGVPVAKVHVTPLGVAPHFAPVPGAKALVRERYGLRPPYVLACVGSGHPRKNLRGVVEAFSRLASSEVVLAIVGTAERDPGAQKAIEASPAREHILRLGHVPEEALPAIYGASEVFCFPSFYEGFGLPVLEAMACGTPVVCANTSSLPEVGGDVAVYIDPSEPEALTAALADLLGDEARRRELGARGVAWAKQFTWERTASLTLRAYRAAEGSA
jgi:glycosyltransferase involved in cell wall biosynthesis